MKSERIFLASEEWDWQSAADAIAELLKTQAHLHEIGLRFAVLVYDDQGFGLTLQHGKPVPAAEYVPPFLLALLNVLRVTAHKFPGVREAIVATLKSIEAAQ